MTYGKLNLLHKNIRLDVRQKNAVSFPAAWCGRDVFLSFLSPQFDIDYQMGVYHRNWINARAGEPVSNITEKETLECFF